MRKMVLSVVAVVLTAGSVAVAEVWPAGFKFNGERKPMSIWQVTEQDAIYFKIRKNVYLNGPTRETLTPSSGPQRLAMPSAKLTVDVTGWTGVLIQRRLLDGSLTEARYESVSGSVDSVQQVINLDFQNTRHDWTFLHNILIGNSTLSIVTPAAVDRLTAECKTDLAVADRIFGMKRSDVIDATGKMSPENMAWAMAGPLNLAGSDDNLTRYDTGEFVMYVSLNRPHTGPTRLVFGGYLFDAKTGKWLANINGSVIASVDDKNRTFEVADVEALLTRVRPAV